MSRENQTPEEREMYAERRRARDRAKSKRRKAEIRAEKARELPKGISATSPERRRLLPPAPEMTKNELRAMLTRAVLNTPGARV